MSSLKILVDGDSCPFKEIIIAIAHRYELESHFYSCQKLPKLEGRKKVKVVECLHDFNAADDVIVRDLKKGDVVVTADLELAKRCLDKGGVVVGYKGLLTLGNIQQAMGLRDLYNQVRGHNQGSKTKSTTKKKLDDRLFRQNLNNLLEKRIKKN